MPRAPNFAYQNPMGDIGGSLVRAIFGDPNAAAEQAQQRAKDEALASQARQNDAQAALYTSQATQQQQQTAASPLFDALMGRLAGRPAPQMIAPPEDPDDRAGFNAAFDSTIGPQAQGQTPEQAFRENFPQMVAAMAQQQGDKVDTSETLAALMAMMGGDEMGRRALVTQGQTPGKDFALTPERADEIAANEAGSKLLQAMSVEGSQSADRRYNVDVDSSDYRYKTGVQSGDTRRGQDVSAASSRYGSDASAGASRYGADVKAAAKRDAAAAKAARPVALKPVNAAGYKVVKNMMEEQLKEQGLQIDLDDDGKLDTNRLEPGAATWIMTRALEHYRRTGNPSGSVELAIRQALNASNDQKAARRALPAPTATPKLAVPEVLRHRREASEAVSKGAPRAAVAAQFKKLTGQTL